jgi:hypothetical protein
MKAPQFPQDSLGKGKGILMQNSSKEDSDARQSERKDKTPNKFSADMVSHCMDAVFGKACHSKKESIDGTKIMEQSKEVDLAVEAARNMLTGMREKPVVIQLSDCLEPYPECEIEQLADQKVVTNTTLSNE